MQLIDIIQLIFLGFIFISLIIIITTYFAYRKRKQSIRNQKNKSAERIIKSEPDSVSNQKATEEKDALKTVSVLTQTPAITKKKKNKFEVFKPASDGGSIKKSKTPDTKQPPKTKL